MIIFEELVGPNTEWAVDVSHSTDLCRSQRAVEKESCGRFCAQL